MSDLVQEYRYFHLRLGQDLLDSEREKLDPTSKVGYGGGRVTLRFTYQPDFS